jgi:hypothetical protein
MKCYECRKQCSDVDAVVLCHHCSAGLCEAHSVCAPDYVPVTEPLVKIVWLPVRARLFFCGSCHAALRQLAGANEDRRKSRSDFP